MSQMYETKSLKPNFLSSFSLMFIGLPFLCSEMASMNLRFYAMKWYLWTYVFPFFCFSEEWIGLGLELNHFCRGELSFLTEYLRVIPASANLRLLTLQQSQENHYLCNIKQRDLWGTAEWREVKKLARFQLVTLLPHTLSYSIDYLTDTMLLNLLRA